jgi:hypothetical protein
MAEELTELKLKDFDFLNGKVLKKLEIRYNEKTSDKLFAKAYFALPGSTKRDDTMLAVYISGKDLPAIMRKMYVWYNEFYLATNAFSKFTAEAMDKAE